MKATSVIKNNRGQVVIEFVMMLAILAFVMSAITKGLKEYELPKKFTAEPWTKLDSMTQCGVWKECGIGKKAAFHPNSEKRRRSLDPE